MMYVDIICNKCDGKLYVNNVIDGLDSGCYRCGKSYYDFDILGKQPILELDRKQLVDYAILRYLNGTEQSETVDHISNGTHIPPKIVGDSLDIMVSKEEVNVINLSKKGNTLPFNRYTIATQGIERYKGILEILKALEDQRTEDEGNSTNLTELMEEAPNS